jgi:UDP-N-acetylmuramoylalanine--D-glutamate ligase
MINLNEFKDKRILILGFAREGQDTLRFLRQLFPKQVFGVADQTDARRLTLDAKKLLQKDKNLKLHFGKGYLERIGDYEIIVKSPGVPPKIIKPYLKRNQIVTSQTEIFFENCPGKIIGVTGTKGKSTTTSLIYEVLKAGGLKAHLVGNIGQPVLSSLLRAKPDDIFVYELSSHQLMNLKKSPSIAVFLNVYPEHLDYYQGFGQYLRAKQNICRWQKSSDFFLFNPKNKYVKETAGITKAQKISLNPKKADTFLKKWGRAKLLGGFNFLNMAAAIEVGRIFKIPVEKIAKAIKSFKPLPHRLELVGEYQGIKFYNDSLATIPEATIAALDALENEVQTIFLGGFDRGLDFKNLAEKILKSRTLKNLIFFPTTGQRIWQAILNKNKGRTRFFNYFFVGCSNKKPALSYNTKSQGEGQLYSNGASIMKEAVKLAFHHTDSGEICLLSCASPSFGLFHDYQERGDLFKKYVREVGKAS